MASQEGISQDQTVDPGIDTKLATHNIWETLGRLNQCGNIRQLIGGKDLQYLLERVELQTFLAPADDSWNSNVEDEVGQKLVEGQLLTRLFHSYDLETTDQVQTLAGERIPIKRDAGTLFVGGARLLKTDIPCTNGVIHVVEGLTGRK